MNDELMHYGILGMKWGIRRYQNPDGTLTNAGKKRYSKVFISGSSKTEFPDSGYYRKELPKDITKELDSIISDNKTVLIGDAPGIDRQVQNYLRDKDYMNVEVYGPGDKQVRYSANSKWKQTTVNNPDAEVGSSEWLAAKDKTMSDLADEGLAVILDNGSSATRANIKRLIGSGKTVKVYELNAAGPDQDRWVYEIEPEVEHAMDKELMHYGVLGMKWGIRRYQNPDKSLTPLGKEHYAKEGFKLRAQENHKTGIGRVVGKLTREGNRYYKKADEETKEAAIKYYQDHLDKQWADKNYDKIESQTYKKVRNEIKDYVEGYLNKKYDTVNRSYLNEYNRQLANLMNQAVDDIQAPSGKVVKFVAKRGEVGVHMALADPGYDMNQLRNGVWGSGKIAYRKQNVDMV